MRNSEIYGSYIGKTIFSRDGKEKGVITNIIDRWCAGCQSMGPTFSVKWQDGARTFPCLAGCSFNKDGTISID